MEGNGFAQWPQIGDRQDEWSQLLHLWALTLAHANSSLNCVVYGVTNKRFR